MENLEKNEAVVTEGVVTEPVAEKVEAPKTYTQEEVDAIVGKRIARNEKKIRKEYDRKYGGLEEVLRAGTGKENVEEMTDTFRQFYEKKGIKMPQQPNYSDSDIAVLARAEADDIIRSGYEDVVDEVDRLTAIGYANMNAKEKAVFKALAEHRVNAERGMELAKLGVTEDVYNGQEFKDFAAQFNASTPIAKIYDIYAKTKPKKEHQTMGSMKSTGTSDNGVKDFYSYEEAKKFSKADFDKNPKLYDAVVKSMSKWK